MILLFINLFLIIIFITLFIIFKKSDKKWNQIDDYLSKVTHTVNSIRYGNLSTKIGKIEHPDYKHLSQSINRMVETLSDREKMIVEYQTELTRQNNFLEAVINSLSDGILIIDEDQKILRVTPKITEWFGQDSKNLLNKRLLDYIQPKEDIKCESFKENEIFIKEKPSETFEATSMELSLEDSKKRFIVIIKDITTQRELEKLREDFVATLTHDLKVPIVAESNILEFLIDGKFGEINEKQFEAVNNMKSCNNELLELVQILLETYKISETGIEITKQKIDIKPFIEEIIEEMQPVSEKTGIKIKTCFQGDIELPADSVQLKRVIKNLIQNAMSHSESKKDVDIITDKFDNFAYIKIIDYGKGISKEDIEKIFNKYYSTAKKFRKIGTGLGLYLSQQIIRAHGGEIIVNSEENVNTEFCIKLPL